MILRDLFAHTQLHNSLSLKFFYYSCQIQPNWLETADVLLLTLVTQTLKTSFNFCESLCVVFLCWLSSISSNPMLLILASICQVTTRGSQQSTGHSATLSQQRKSKVVNQKPVKSLSSFIFSLTLLLSELMFEVVGMKILILKLESRDL